MDISDLQHLIENYHRKIAKIGGASEFSRQFNHSYHEKGQKEKEDGVAEGIAHAVVEELHTGFGPEEPRGYVEGPVGEAEDETREREGVRL